MTYLEGTSLRNYRSEVGAAAQNESVCLPLLFAANHSEVRKGAALQQTCVLESAIGRPTQIIARNLPEVRRQMYFAHNCLPIFDVDSFGGR